jgi:hypothetical protein
MSSGAIAPEQDTELDILVLVRRLEDTIGWEQVPRWFQERNFKARLLYDGAVLTIKYEQFNQLWRPRWARQCRGIAFLRQSNGITSTIVCIKSLLMRGAELQIGLPAVAKELDAAQLVSVDWLHREEKDNEDGPAEAFLSGKVDGSLLGVTLIPRARPDLCAAVEALIATHGDAFAQAVVRRCAALPYVAFFSSQGTLFLHASMQDYAVTALVQGALDQVDKAELRTPEMELLARGDAFFAQLDTFWRAHQHTNDALVSLSFEGVCARRTSAWGEEHIELAVSYERSTLLFLGATLDMTPNSVGAFVPHADRRLAHPWTEPRAWTVGSGKRVRDMIAGLERLVSLDDPLGQAGFLQLFPPDQASHEQQRQELDLEGFILMRRDKITGEWCYSKLKTQAYYRTHRVDASNISFLVRNMSVGAAARLPLVRFTHAFFHAFGERFARVSHEVRAALLEPVDAPALLAGLPVKAQSGFDARPMCALAC